MSEDYWSGADLPQRMVIAVKAEKAKMAPLRKGKAKATKAPKQVMHVLVPVIACRWPKKAAGTSNPGQ